METVEEKENVHRHPSLFLSVLGAKETTVDCFLLSVLVQGF